LLWHLCPRPGVARRRPGFFCLAKRNRGKKRRALQAAGPAELTARLQRSVQTAAGDMKEFHKGEARRLRVQGDHLRKISFSQTLRQFICL